MPILKKTGGHRPVDVHVGARVRQRRTLLGFSQEKLGEAVGLTFQQIQKYERGANRIGASRLYEFSQIMDVPVSYFFEDMPDEAARTKGGHKGGLADQGQDAFEGVSTNPLIKRETLELVRAYYKISDPKVRKRMFELVKAVANGDA